MRAIASLKSTNVRSMMRAEAAGAVIAFVLWTAFVAALAGTGTLEILDEVVTALAAFAAAFATLAYARDAELRRCIDGMRTGTALAALAPLAALAATGMELAILVALPPAALLLAALATRVARGRVSSGTAGLPGGTPAAPSGARNSARG